MRVLRLLASLAAVSVFASCGVQADDDPRVIPEGRVPFDLLAPSTTAPATTVPVATVPATVYMVRDGRLEPVTRTVPSPVSLGTVLAVLIQGTNNAEAGAGLRSAVDESTRVQGAEVNGDTATINLSNGFAGIGLQDQILAVAQVIYTATSIPDVERVQVLLNSQANPVPRGDGTLTRDPLTRGDFAGVAPVER